MDPDKPQPDVLLRGKKVRRRYGKRYGDKMVAPTIRVSLYRTGETYDHPTVTFKWGHRYSGEISIKFQAHRLGVRDAFGDLTSSNGRARGFLALDFQRSSSYSGEISGKLDDARELAWTIDLWKAANKAFYDRFIYDTEAREPRPQGRRLCKDDDAVLALVIGLQLLGFDVEIFNRYIRDQRTKRGAARRLRALVREDIAERGCSGPYPDAPEVGAECGATHGTCPKHDRAVAS